MAESFGTACFSRAMPYDLTLLQSERADTLIIELASAPGGTDLKRAEELHLHVIDAPSLPGRVAPKTAAEYIKEAVYNILEE